MDEIALSKLLSYVLRHHPEQFGLSLDDQGWVSVSELLSALNQRGHAVDRARLVQVVQANPKQRFAFSEDGQAIRANQGHSVPVALGHPAQEPPAVLFHGTVARSLPLILAEGLLPGQRHHVHLSETVETARAVGSRRGPPVVLAVLAAQMHADGHAFFRSPNGVWLTERVPPVYLRPTEGDAELLRDG